MNKSEIQFIFGNITPDQISAAYHTGMQSQSSTGLDMNTLITALVGLFGVIVGACISYYFSKRISDSSSKARFAIQRKNLIYSKIYKELVFIKQQINVLPPNMFYFEVKTNLHNSYVGGSGKYYIGDSRDYIAPDFYVWEEMKNDIRITQVNKEVSVKMDHLEKALIEYLNSVDKVAREVEDNRKEFSHNVMIDNTFFFSDPLDKDDLIKKLSKPWVSSKNAIHEASILKVVEATLEKPYVEDAKQNFFLLKKAVDDANQTLEKLIRDIVAKYEYGEEI